LRFTLKYYVNHLIVGAFSTRTGIIFNNILGATLCCYVCATLQSWPNTLTLCMFIKQEAGRI